MGFFSSVTSFFGKIADKAVQTIIPGCQWKPSSLLKEVDQYLPVVVDAIPAVGPFLSHAVPAISAIFGGSDKQPGAEISKLPSKSEVETMLETTIKAIAESRDSFEAKLNDLQAQATKQAELAAFDDFLQKIQPAVKYIKDHADTLQGFLPFGGNNQIKNYITKDRNHDKNFELHHFNLETALVQLELYLTHHSPVTQEMLDLYVLGATWLLTYDKTVMLLRSYLAQHFLVNNAMTSYTDCITSWNEDFSELQRHALNCARFLLGNTDNPGLIQDQHNKRLKAITDVSFAQEEDVMKGTWKWEDTYAKHGIGHAAGQSGSSEIILANPTMSAHAENEEQKKGMEAMLQQVRSGYIATNMGYLEVATQAAKEAAQVWQDSVHVWKSRIPLSPPLDAVDLIKATPNSKLDKEQFSEARDGEKVGLGWQKKQTLCYAVSYVTTNGEGFLSNWSDPPIVITKNNEFVKLSIGAIRLPESVFIDTTKYHKQTNPLEVEVEIVRRVYVKMTFNDETRTYSVGQLKGRPTETLTLWDQAEHYRPVSAEED